MITITTLQEVAAKYYNKLAVAYVNISLYPMWTYGMTPIAEDTGNPDSWVNKFPRVLIFRLENHHKAAFLRLSGEELDLKDVKVFVEEYIKYGRMEDCNGI